MHLNTSSHHLQTLIRVLFSRFTFTGTGVWLYGAFSTNHDGYSITLDDQALGPFNGFRQTFIPRQVLFGLNGLTQAEHTLVFTNAPTTSNLNNWFLDVDYIIYETQVVANSTPVTTILEDSNSTVWAYSPSSSWTAVTNSQFHNGDGHQAATPGASATATFDGQSVTVFGLIGPDQGNYTVQVDNGPTTTFNAAYPTEKVQVPLAAVDGLTQGPHNITLTVIAGILLVDYASVIGATAEAFVTGQVFS